MSVPILSVPLFGIGMTEWLVIGIAIVLFFGAAKLPKLGKGLGEGIRNFKKGITGELEAEESAATAKGDKPKSDETAIEKES